MENSKGKTYSYNDWRIINCLKDTEKARDGYAKYQKQLDILKTEKRKPGRPATGKALTPAEKQRAYRERLKKREIAFTNAQMDHINKMVEAWQVFEKTDEQKDFEEWKKQAETVAHIIIVNKENMNF
jgi:hypothetical protein